MPKNESRFTVFFQPPYWVGVYERIEEGCLTVSKITFGAEPKDYQVHEFLLQHWGQLRFSPPVQADAAAPVSKNPKRVQRSIASQLASQGVHTKSQQALKLQQQAGKQARKKHSRSERLARQKQQFKLHQQKKKEKKRGH